MDRIKEFLTVRNIFIIASVVIFIEVVWAVWALVKPDTVTVQPVVNTSPTNTQVSNLEVDTLSLLADKTSLKKGEKLTLNINMSSKVKSIGVDLVILYDPKLLTVTETKNGPVKTGEIFKDYPLNALDNKNGKITVSGITDISGGVLAQGLFGSVDFVAKEKGKTTISLDFIPGSTADTNITESESGKDVLQKVENAVIQILP